MILFFLSFVSLKEVRNCYKGGGGHVYFAKYNINLFYIFIKKITFSYISLVKSGLTPCTISFLFRLHFCSKLSLSSRNPKQQTVDGVIVI